MLANIFTKSVHDRWVGTTVAMVIVGAFLVLGMAAYQQVDTSLYTDLPEAMRQVMGIPEGADPASLSYGVMFGLITAMTLAGLAVSMGASTFAGEERDGTVGLLLGNPRSRRQVLAARVGAMLGLVGFGGLLAFGAGRLAPVLVGAEIGSSDVLAVSVHLLVNAVLFGSLAAAVGAWTGNRALASGVAAGAMVLSYFLVGLLPLLESGGDVARFLPWFWFDGHDPLTNGISVGHLALQGGFASGLLGVAWLGVERRDLRKPMSERSLIAKVSDHPQVQAIVARLGGQGRVSGVWAKATSENQALLIIASMMMFAMMGLLMGPMFVAIEGSLASMTESLPDNFMALVGGGDMSTPEGWYQAETYGLMGPIAVTLVAASLGSKALAGEEGNRTMGLLLANPVSRAQVVFHKAAAMAIHAAVVGLATFLGVAGGALLGDLGMSIGNIAATSLLMTLLGLLFGAVALALGAATGQVRVAVLGTIGTAGAAYAVNAIFSIADSLEGGKAASPFDWYLGSDPLNNGMDWGAAALFVGLSALLVALAAGLFERRDLRRT